MRVLAWNIRRGGGKRAEPIVAAVLAHAPTVVVLSEFQGIGSASIVEALDNNGWSHCATTEPLPRLGGIAVLSTAPLEVRQPPLSLKGLDRHYLAVSVPIFDLQIRAVYGPLHRDPHARFWSQLLTSLRSESLDDVLVTGDFNSGSPNSDGPSNVLCGKFFDRLPDAGFTDLWRTYAGADAREHTWQGRKNPYRLDHAFGSTSLVSRVRACRYSHDERIARVSDHSVMLIDIDERRE